MEETAQVLQEVRQDESILLNQRHLLAAVEEALRHLQDGTYGHCLSCGEPIGPGGSGERLSNGCFLQVAASM